MADATDHFVDLLNRKQAAQPPPPPAPAHVVDFTRTTWGTQAPVQPAAVRPAVQSRTSTPGTAQRTAASDDWHDSQVPPLQRDPAEDDLLNAPQQDPATMRNRKETADKLGLTKGTFRKFLNENFLDQCTDTRKTAHGHDEEVFDDAYIGRMGNRLVSAGDSVKRSRQVYEAAAEWARNHRS